jgi:hypothetical protein
MSTHPVIATKPKAKMKTDAEERSAIDHRLAELRTSLPATTPEISLQRFYDLHGDLDAHTGKVKRRLLGTALAWTDEEKDASAWIHSASHGMARLGRRLVDSFYRTLEAADDRTLDVAALTLHYMAETVKCEIAVGRQDPYDYRGTHAIMKLALFGERQRTERHFLHDGRKVTCTIESLYFRALLLAKYSGGNLNTKQIEILDACIWNWMSALRSVREAPSGSPLRADLDSSEGLRHAPHAEGKENALYLPQAPLEAAYRSAIKEFHAGRIVPADGLTSEFRIEEHVAVLNVIRLDLRESRDRPVVRAERHAVGFEAEAFVGLNDIMMRGFRRPSSSADFAARGAARRAQSKSENHDPTSGIYDPVRRHIQWTDVSDTGMGASWKPGECGDISLGDLVGIRRSWGEPLIVGRVVRSVPSADGERIAIGVSIISSSVQPITLSRPGNGKPLPGIDTLFIAGNEVGGRHDAYLVPDRLYRDVGPFEATVGDDVYEFRFNRVRERGNGWALAGFEITATRPNTPALEPALEPA